MLYKQRTNSNYTTRLNPVVNFDPEVEKTSRNSTTGQDN